MSKFKELFQQTHPADEEGTNEAKIVPQERARRPVSTQSTRKSEADLPIKTRENALSEIVPEKIVSVSLPTDIPKRGRPPGKRSDPDFVQITAYVPRSTHRAIKLALLEDGQDKEISTLLSELMEQWLDQRK